MTKNEAQTSARELSASESASFAKTLARSPRHVKASEDINCHICGKLWHSQHTDQERTDCSAAL